MDRDFKGKKNSEFLIRGLWISGLKTEDPFLGLWKSSFLVSMFCVKPHIIMEDYNIKHSRVLNMVLLFIGRFGPVFIMCLGFRVLI